MVIQALGPDLLIHHGEIRSDIKAGKDIFQGEIQVFGKLVQLMGDPRGHSPVKSSFVKNPAAGQVRGHLNKNPAAEFLCGGSKVISIQNSFTLLQFLRFLQLLLQRR